MSYIGNSPSASRLRFTPQATQPTNAQEGDIYYDDGTNRQEGLYQFKDTAWVLVGSGTNDSIVQYITNGDAETGVTSGWATYADAAGVAPVDGTGGSANVTIAASATAPLRGQYSFLLSKDANDRQGQGWSYDFSINDADKAKVLTINFDYVVNSGTFVAGSNSTLSDVVVYIYDVTNSTLIQPSSVKLFSNSSTISDVFEAQFQTSATGSDYRLILHVASTSASAYSLKVDNVRVSPSQYVFGTPITDWSSFTPVTSHVANVTWTGLKRRVGDTAEYSIRGAYTGATTSATLTMTIPDGTIDPNKINSIVAQDQIFVGSGAFTDSGVGNYPVYTAYDSSNAVRFLTPSADSATTDNRLVTITQNLQGTGTDVAIANGDSIRVTFAVPIAGWSSSVQMSDKADTRVVAFYAYRNTNQTGVNPNNSQVKINLDAIVSDTHGAFDTSAFRYVVPVSGYYMFSAGAGFGNTNTLANNYVLRLIVNGSSTYAVDVEVVASVGQLLSMQGTSPRILLNAGDYVELFLFGSGNNSVSTLTAQGGSGSTWLSGNLVSGPSAIAATETIALSVNTSTTAATANVTPINFTNVLRDTHNSYSAGTYTVPASGLYLIHAQTFTAAAHTAYIYIDNTSAAQGSNVGSASQASDVFALRPLTAGQTIQIRIDASQTLSGGAVLNRLSIIRQGL